MKAVSNTPPTNTELFDSYLKEILSNDLKEFKSGKGKFLGNNSSKYKTSYLIA